MYVFYYWATIIFIIVRGEPSLSNPFSSAKNTVFNCVINCSTNQFISIHTHHCQIQPHLVYPMQLFVMLLIKIKIMNLFYSFVSVCHLSFRFWCHYFFLNERIYYSKSRNVILLWRRNRQRKISSPLHILI